MTATPNTFALREADDCIHLFECQLARATALAALCSAKGQREAAARAGRAVSQGGQDLAALPGPPPPAGRAGGRVQG